MSELLREVNKFFDNCDTTDSVSLIRNDGIVLYSSVEDKFKIQTIGALVSGVWQASKALSNLAGSSELSEYRLSFDTSDSGIYIIPVTIDGTEFYLSVLYNSLKNPAIIKNQLRAIRNSLVEKVSTSKISLKRNGFLFENITDGEMDNLFQVMELT